MMKRLALLAPLLLVGCVFYRGPDAWIPARVPLSAERIAELKRAGVSDATLRRELDHHGVERKLDADDLVTLKDAGAGDEFLAAAAAAPVREAEEARPVYYRHAHSHHGCDYCHASVPFFIGTALSLNYVFGRSWRVRGCRPGARW